MDESKDKALLNNIQRIEAVQSQLTNLATTPSMKAKLDPILSMLSDASEDMMYERAARELLKWLNDGLKAADGKLAVEILNEAARRISNLDRLSNPESYPVGRLVVQESSEKKMLLEMHFTNMVRTLGPGTHQLYLSMEAAQAAVKAFDEGEQLNGDEG